MCLVDPYSADRMVPAIIRGENWRALCIPEHTLVCPLLLAEHLELRILLLGLSMCSLWPCTVQAATTQGPPPLLLACPSKPTLTTLPCCSNPTTNLDLGPTFPSRLSGQHSRSTSPRWKRRVPPFVPFLYMHDQWHYHPCCCPKSHASMQRDLYEGLTAGPGTLHSVSQT